MPVRSENVIKFQNGQRLKTKQWDVSKRGNDTINMFCVSLKCFAAHFDSRDFVTPFQQKFGNRNFRRIDVLRCGGTLVRARAPSRRRVLTPAQSFAS